MKILKFGGSSLADETRIAAVAEIIQNAASDGKIAVVVSALAGITDALEACVDLAIAGSDYHAICDEISSRHQAAALALADDAERSGVASRLAVMAEELREILHGIILARDCSPQRRDLVMSFGERLASVVVAAALRARGLPARDCDTRQLIVTDDSFGSATVLPETSGERIRQHFQGQRELQVVTGYIGATTKGQTTTLGRNSTDLTAAVVGAALDADCVELWTDVDGIMSADPRIVADAFSLSELEYDEATELSRFGAKVLFPHAVQPTRSRGIPIVVRNSYNPAFPGTAIVSAHGVGAPPICNVSGHGPWGLIRLKIGEHDDAHEVGARCLTGLARGGIASLLLRPAIADGHVYVTVPPEGVPAALAHIGEELALDQQRHTVERIETVSSVSIIALIGNGATEADSASLLESSNLLQRNGIRVHMIDTAVSRIARCFVVDREHEIQAVRALHDRLIRPFRPRGTAWNPIRRSRSVRPTDVDKAAPRSS